VGLPRGLPADTVLAIMALQAPKRIRASLVLEMLQLVATPHLIQLRALTSQLSSCTINHLTVSRALEEITRTETLITGTPTTART